MTGESFGGIHTEVAMNRNVTRKLTGAGLLGVVLAVAAAGCDLEPSVKPAAPPKDKGQKAEAVRKVELARNIFLEVEGKKGEKRRVVVSASVCLQRGALELLMTRKDTKEHEAVLSADIDARELHKALLLAKARPGSPVKYDPKYQPATGQRIKITVVYEVKGKRHTHPAQEWVLESATKKTLKVDWVFAGSKLVPNPLDPKKPLFLANDGDLVCVSNFETALLDLPIKSSKANSELSFEANTPRIPPVGTKVSVVFEPIPEKK
jgi:hypothetical protein